MGTGKTSAPRCLRASKQVRIGRAIFLHSDAETLDGTVLVECGDDLNPCIRFRHGESRREAKGLECRDRLRAASDKDRLIKPRHDQRQRMARTYNVEEGGCADARHEDKDIDLSVDQSGAETQRGRIVPDGNFPEGGTYERLAAITFDQSGHLRCHTAFECRDCKARESFSAHHDLYPSSLEFIDNDAVCKRIKA